MFAAWSRMAHHVRLVALVACLAVTGTAEAGTKHRAKVAPPVEQDEDEDEDTDEEQDGDDATTDRVALAEEADEEEADEIEAAPVPKLRTRHRAGAAKDWHLAIGPYLWASSVDANISLGSSSVGAGVDFFEMQRHAKYGAEALVEARVGKLSFTGDLMWGVVGIDGAREVGPLMVTIDGTASSLLVDGAAGYRLAGGERDLLSLEVRAGVRYQRTSVSGTVQVGTSPLAGTTVVDAGGDALAGARVFVRPTPRFYLSASGDVGVVGSSNATWSATADAGVRLGQRVQLSLGYRTLMIDRANVAMTMHGPRAALQLLF